MEDQFNLIVIASAPTAQRGHLTSWSSERHSLIFSSTLFSMFDAHRMW